MERQRIIDARSYAALVEELLKLVAPLRANDILMVDMASSRKLRRRCDKLQQSLLGEERHVTFGDDAAFLVPALKVAQTHTEDSRLQRVEAAVDADLFMKIGLARAVNAKVLYALRKLWIIGYGDHTTVSVAAEVFRREEGEAAHIADGAAARYAAVNHPVGADGLRTVLDERYTAAFQFVFYLL